MTNVGMKYEFFGHRGDLQCQREVCEEVLAVFVVDNFHIKIPSHKDYAIHSKACEDRIIAEAEVYDDEPSRNGGGLGLRFHSESSGKCHDQRH